MKISLYHPHCLHEMGQRENNEDNVYPAKDSAPQSGAYQLYLVCDGVGGMERGEVASQITCDVIAKHLSGKDHISESDIDHAVLLAEQAIDSYIQQNIDALGMATTLTLLCTHEEGVTIAHIGDSRVYHIRAGKILHQTFDHSFVNELLAKRIISEEEALNHPKRNVVTKAIMGGGDHQVPDFHHTQQLLPGDYFFLCTDGITESVSDVELAGILNTQGWTNAQKIEAIKLKCRQHSKDNHSAYLLQVEAVKQEGFANTITSLINDKPWQVFLGIVGIIVLVLSVFLMGSSAGNDKAIPVKKEVEKNEDKLNMLDSMQKEIEKTDFGAQDSLGQQDSTLQQGDSLALEAITNDSTFIQDSIQQQQKHTTNVDTSRTGFDVNQND